MKSSELYRILTRDGWYSIHQVGSHMKMAHATKKALTRSGYLEVPYHGSKEVDQNLARKLLKQAGL